MSYHNPWIYKNKIFTSDEIKTHVAFVYIITNVLNNKKYIGKKTFINVNRIKQANRKLRKVSTRESDWQNYYGSSKNLLEDIKIHGKENFKRKILYLCKKKSHASYYEAKEQFKHGCLESDDFYNEWIFCKVRKVHMIGK